MWERKETIKGLEGRPREYRVTNLARGKHSMAFLAAVRAFVEEGWRNAQWLPYKHEVGATGATALEAYKVLSKAAGTVFI